MERLGNRASLSFENLWAMSGFADESRAQTAVPGVVAPKSEPTSNAAMSEKLMKARETKLAHKPKVRAPVGWRKQQLTAYVSYRKL